jgi:uncharacterized membrane protein YdjX (TVP38/TMEM64 family)
MVRGWCVALGLSSITLLNYCVGTLASLPAMFGYVSIGALTHAGVTAWERGAGPLRWTLLGIGLLAATGLTIRLGQIAMKLGLLSDKTRCPLKLGLPLVG